MAESRIKLKGEDAASAVVDLVGHSLGDLTAEALKSAKAVADLKKELQEAVNKGQQGSIAAISAQLDDAIPKLQEAEKALKNGLKPAVDQNADAFGFLTDAIKNPGAAAIDLAGTLRSSIVAAGGESALAILGIGAAAVAGGAALVSLAADARETAASLNDIREVTRMSVPALSDLKFAIEASGGSLQQVNGLLFDFEKRMETSSEKVDAGLRRIGLSLEQVAAMPADERLLAISTALQGAGADVNLAATAFEIFGANGRDALPLLLKPLKDLTEESKRLNFTISNEQAQAADDFSTSLEKMRAEADATWTQLGLHVSLADQVSYAYERMKLAVANVAYTTASAAVGIVTLDQYLPALIEHLRGVADAIPEVTGDASSGVAKITAGAKEQAAGMGPWNAAIAEAARVSKELDASAKELVETHKKQAAEAQRLAEVYANVHSSSADLSGAQVEAIRYYKAEGDSVADIAKVLEVYQHQVEQVVAADKARAESTKQLIALQKAQKASLDDLLKSAGQATLANLKLQGSADKKIDESVAKNTQTDRQRALAEVEQWVTDEEAKLDKRAANWEAASERIQAAARAQVADINASFDLIDNKDLFTFVGPEIPAETAAQQAKSFSARFDEVVSKDIPAILMRAFEGGGGVMGAVKSLAAKIGGDLFGSDTVKGWTKSLTEKVSGFLNVGKGLFGDALSGIMSGGVSMAINVGMQLISKGIEKLMSIGGPSEQEKEGRAVVEEFEARFSSAKDMIERVGEAYRANGKTSEEAQAAIQRMWAAEKLGADETRRALAAINEELKRHQEVTDAISAQGFQSQDEITHAADIANAAYQAMVAAAGQYTEAQIKEAYRHYQELLAQLEGAAGDAARAWLEANGAASGAATATSKVISDLQKQRDEIAGTYANEAAEAEMGSVERDARARVAALEAQMAAQQAAVDENTKQATDAAQTIEDEFGGCWGRTRDGGISAAQEISDYFEGLDIHVPITFDYEEPEFNGTGRAKSYANEGYDLTRPHLARIGDATGDSESVLRAQTVRDIVRASRNAGAAQATGGGTTTGGDWISLLNRTMERVLAVLQSNQDRPATPVIMKAVLEGRDIVLSSQRALDAGGDLLAQHRQLLGIA